MKKTLIVIVCILLLAAITAGTFAIYKSSLNGSIEADCAQVIAEISTEENNEFRINPDNLTVEYDFTIKNYITEGTETTRNQVICNYYIKISGVSNEIFNVILYSMDENAAGTALSKVEEGEFKGYYATNNQLVIDEDVEQQYKLYIQVEQANLVNYITDVNIDLGYEQSVPIEQYVNEPDLATGMIPVVYDEVDKLWKKTSSNSESWYNYDQKKWANVITTTESSYATAADGTPIQYSDITGMFVWIPRYVYRIDEKYYHETVTDGQILDYPPIDIHFSKKEDAGGDDWDQNIIVVNTGVEAGDCKNSWTTHKAFEFGDEYLNGFWVGKFQANIKENNAYISPAQLIKTTITFDTAFTFCRNMETSSIYGWQTANNLQNDGTFATDDNGLDTHLIKNSEWSAIAYLTHSKYGVGAVNIENSVISKYSGQSSDVNEVFGRLVSQSTTNNAYGIYDMSSQTWNMISAYIGMEESINSPIIYNAIDKYKDVYTSEKTVDFTSKDSVYEMFQNIKDAAIWEVSTSGNATNSAWFSSRSNIGSIVNGTKSLLMTRGGAVNGIDSIFSFGNGNGTETSSSRAFRPTIVVKNGL